MTSLHPARRNAERFDALVASERLDVEGVDARTAELLELVGALRAVPEPEARPEFVSDLREQLMLAARAQLSPEKAPRDVRTEELDRRLTVAPRKSRHDRRLSIALGSLAIVGATSGMAVASQGSLPGDVLYPVKRVIENTHAGISTDQQAKGRTMLATATARLDEVGELTRGDDVDAALVTSTLQDFTDQATEASDVLMTDYEQTGRESSISRLHAFTATSMATLGRLDASVPESAQPALLDAAQQLFTIDEAAGQLCPACSGDGITEIPGQLLVSAGTEADDDQPGSVAGGELPGTQPSQSPAEVATPDSLSGIDPPEVPVQIPSIPPLTQTPQLPTQGATEQGGTSSGGGGNGGNGGGQQGPKPTKPTPPVDLGETLNELGQTVDGTVGGVTDVVGGVVQGVTGILNGVTGGLLGGQPTQTP